MKFKRLLKINNVYVKCDKCYLVEPTTKKDMKSFLNKECPVCGHNLLTEDDYAVAKRMLWIEKWFGWIPIPSFSKEEKSHHVHKVCGRFRMDSSDGDQTWL